MTKKINLSQFGHNVQKYLVSFVTASFNNNKRQMIKISEQKKNARANIFHAGRIFSGFPSLNRSMRVNFQ